MARKQKKVAHKYIFVLGGVMSGIGKGITTASIGTILQGKGFRVNLIKVDPYLNVDAGTMNPTEHGEVFVLDSGLETDQDMGNYERFLNQDAAHDDYITSGMVYQSVIERERNLGYKGKCVEAIPDIVNEITERIKKAEKENRSDITVIEVGGTIGDYQNIMFIEAARSLSLACPNDVAFVLVSYVPFPAKIGEPKTRPTRIASRSLNSYGVQADVIIARSEVDLDQKRLEKLAVSCSVPKDNVISAPDIDSIYDVPHSFERGHIGRILAKRLSLSNKKGKGLAEWKRFVNTKDRAKKEVRIAIVGKYFDTGEYTLADSYISVIEALKAAAYKEGVKPVLDWINSKKFEKKDARLDELKKYDGVLVPGGFGTTGIEGKIKVIKYAREKKIPYFGLCYGMQLAVVEYARHKAGIPKAQTAEIDPNAKDLVIGVMEEQEEKLKNEEYGGTMRLGAWPAKLKKGTVARKAYKSAIISERHRHRYEVNLEYIEQLEKAGLVFSGTSPDGRLMEIAELPQKDHPFFVGTQFHPEFLSRPLTPHPLFAAFIRAAKK